LLNLTEYDYARFVAYASEEENSKFEKSLDTFARDEPTLGKQLKDKIESVRNVFNEGEGNMYYHKLTQSFVIIGLKNDKIDRHIN